MEDLKPCPFCGVTLYPPYWDNHREGCVIWLMNRNRKVSDKAWNSRPLENALHAEIKELEYEKESAIAARDILFAYLNWLRGR